MRLHDNDRWRGSFAPDRARAATSTRSRPGPTIRHLAARLRAEAEGRPGRHPRGASKARAADQGAGRRTAAASGHPASSARITCRPATPTPLLSRRTGGRRWPKASRGRDLTRSAAVPARGRPAAGARRRLVRDGAAQPGHRARASTARSTIASRGCPTSPRSASTCSISRRSIRSARTNRKGRNNALKAEPGDPGSPYAIGSGRRRPRRRASRARHARRFPRASSPPAATHGMEVALDFAVQCSPDHPWLKQHPDWFKRRPDGSIHYAENPPKKYEDIVNPGFLLRRRAARCGRRCATSCCSGSSRACASSASTIRTPSRSRSGNG